MQLCFYDTISQINNPVMVTQPYIFIQILSHQPSLKFSLYVTASYVWIQTHAPVASRAQPL